MEVRRKNLYLGDHFMLLLEQREKHGDVKFTMHHRKDPQSKYNKTKIWFRVPFSNLDKLITFLNYFANDQ